MSLILFKHGQREGNGCIVTTVVAIKIDSLLYL